MLHPIKQVPRIGLTIQGVPVLAEDEALFHRVIESRQQRA